MKYKGIYRWLIIVLFSYVATILATAFFNRGTWSFQGNLAHEGKLLLKFAVASLFYLFCYAIQANDSLIGKVGMWIMMVGTAVLFFTIYKNIDGLTVKPFGFSAICDNVFLTAGGLAMVAVMAKIVGMKRNNEGGESSPGFLKEFDN